MVNSLKMCPICRQTVEPDEQIALRCACSNLFHYECIYLNHQTNLKYNNFRLGRDLRNCPYCQTDGGLLPLKEGYKPLYGVHYVRPPANLDIGLGFNNLCQAVIKSNNSTRKGQTCDTFSGNLPFCNKHKKDLSYFLVKFSI